MFRYEWVDGKYTTANALIYKINCQKFLRIVKLFLWAFLLLPNNYHFLHMYLSSYHFFSSFPKIIFLPLHECFSIRSSLKFVWISSNKLMKLQQNYPASIITKITLWQFLAETWLRLSTQPLFKYWLSLTWNMCKIHIMESTKQLAQLTFSGIVYIHKIGN